MGAAVLAHKWVFRFLALIGLPSFLRRLFLTHRISNVLLYHARITFLKFHSAEIQLVALIVAHVPLIG